jgi:nitrogenase molybdenum-iron protein alpha/beta subunit
VNRDGNTARWIRAATEHLGVLAEEYRDHGKDEAADEVEEVQEALGRLHRLPDPDEGEDEGDD